MARTTITRKRSVVTERSGLNFMRQLFEDANCIFKEIDQRHDVGQDAFVLLVDDESVTHNEVALQIKSGDSYCNSTTCSIPADPAHLLFWRNHPLTTYGIVYDPKERAAYWTDLKAEAEAIHFRRKEITSTIQFKKSEWNRISRSNFQTLFLSFLMHRPLGLTFEEACEWALSKDPDLHDLGLGTLLWCYRSLARTWDIIFKIFENRTPSITSPRMMLFLAHAPTHYDLLSYFSTGVMDETIREEARARIAKFGRREIEKLLAFVDENGFERSTIGQHVGAIIITAANHKKILSTIVADKRTSASIREAAKDLIENYDYLPIHPR